MSALIALALAASLVRTGDDPLLRYMQCPSDESRLLRSSGKSAGSIADEGLRRCEPLIGAALDFLEADVRRDPDVARSRAAESAKVAAARRQTVAVKVRRAARESAVKNVVEMRALAQRR